MRRPGDPLNAVHTGLGQWCEQAPDGTSDVDHEILDLAGQKLQLSASEILTVERPGRLHVSRQGPIAEVELFFDGKVVTIHGKNLNAYAQIDSPGTIDNAIQTVRAETGLDAPGAELLYADPYPGLVTDVMSGAYLGTAFVNGVECHHLAFRAAKVDWQLWVQYGDKPLPMKYVITSKWMTGAPTHSVRFRDWDTKPRIEPVRFAFSAPEGAKKLEAVPVGELGEIMIEEVQ